MTTEVNGGAVVADATNCNQALCDPLLSEYQRLRSSVDVDGNLSALHLGSSNHLVATPTCFCSFASLRGGIFVLSLGAWFG